MSFSFQWPRFSDQFHADAIEMLNSALNKGPKPPVIADKIEVVELEMGTQPPELEIRDIGDLTTDQFRGIFRLTYAGDAHLVLRTKVQANPLNHKQHEIHLMGGSPGMLAAKQPLVVPMLLRLSHFRLNSYVVLVVSKQKGITLVFKTDPLQNVDINSTFDSIAVIQNFIQKEIEGQLRQMFREDLPGIIHRLSQQWVKAKVEAPYLTKRPIPPSAPSSRRSMDMMSMSVPDPLYFPPRFSAVGLQPTLDPAVALPPYYRARSSSGMSVASTSRRTSATIRTAVSQPAPDPPDTSFPDIENFDPTYGLRPEGLPAKSLFSGFGRLFDSNKGLADLAEEPSEDDFEEGGSYDVVDWDDMVPDITPAPSVVESERRDVPEYETLPAVGGGTITRPRVFHSQSQIQRPEGVSRAPSESSSSRLTRAALESLSPMGSVPLSSSNLVPRRAMSTYGLYYPGVDLSSPQQLQRSTSMPPTPPLYRSPLHRPLSPSSMHTQPSRSSSHTHSVPTPPSTDLPHSQYQHKRRASISSSASQPLDAFYTGSSSIAEPDPKIVLRPAINNTISQLHTLSHSNHTLSPYTRALEHFTVRSVPPRAVAPVPATPAPVRARRKRTYRLGGSKQPDTHADLTMDAALEPPSSPIPPSEFDEDDMNRYFRSRDDLEHYPPDLHPSHVRRRRAYRS
ncbi:hypothetical protein EW146_g3123 [Bondarzewia mesenterica]|uniref:Mitochondrial distribution and morphology protein 34 n=1 Tax=Bondarzewia mesenterica TaxID=1095465 RepID=A0A4S4LYI9_9AGAM|nr:hypothetical protein EW146_g3123 [Bondarzewia mesenterica]